MLAIALLDASIMGACAVTVTTQKPSGGRPERGVVVVDEDAYRYRIDHGKRRRQRLFR